MAKNKELADHERAHSGKAGAKPRHGADAVGKVNPKGRGYQDSPGGKLAVINDHRVALGYPRLRGLSDKEIDKHTALIEKHAPYGNDPWGEKGNDYGSGM